MRRDRVLAEVGLDEAGLARLAGRCAVVRHELGLPSGRWTAARLAEVLATAVLDGGWPAGRVVDALLSVAADPATRSPARLSCAGPWWDQPADQSAPAAPQSTGLPTSPDLVALEAVLAETGGLRVVLQRQARADLAAEGLPVTRLTVARRAVDLLSGTSTPGPGPATGPVTGLATARSARQAVGSSEPVEDGVVGLSVQANRGPKRANEMFDQGMLLCPSTGLGE